MKNEFTEQIKIDDNTRWIPSEQLIEEAMKERRKKMVEMKKRIEARRNALIECWETVEGKYGTERCYTTANNLVADLGITEAAIAVAEAVNAAGYDRRIGERVQTWAWFYPGVKSIEELHNMGFYSLNAWIHPYELTMIAICMRGYISNRD